MNYMKDNWFSEVSNLWPGECMSLEVNKVLHSEQTEYQHILVLDTKTHGVALVLDGIIQCTQKDEFAYQEMIAFLPLCSHPNPVKVLIVGGGDGGVAREVARHPKVQEIHQVEIDSRVMEVSKKYLGFMSEGFDSPKITVHVGDGFEYMKQKAGEFDVIITDSSDPVGPAVSLFQESYFSLMKTALKPNGMVCSQAGTVWCDLEHVKSTLGRCRSQFPTARYAYTSVPTYPSGQIGFVLGSLDQACDLANPTTTFDNDELDSMGLRYYSTEVHKAAFVLPRFAHKELL